MVKAKSIKYDHLINEESYTNKKNNKKTQPLNLIFFLFVKINFRD